MKRTYSLEDFHVKKYEGILDNGLRAIFIERPFSPIRANIFMRAGSNFDPVDKNGLAHFTEHILAAGSKSFYKEDFWGIMESVGGYRNASTSGTSMSVQCEVALIEHMDKMKDHFTHALSEINVVYDEVERQKSIITAEIAKKYSKSERKEQSYVNSIFSNGSSWNRETLGTIDSVSSFTTADVEDFFQTHCCVENMVLVVVGGCSWDDVRNTFSQIPLLKGFRKDLPPDPIAIDPYTVIRYEQDVPETKIRVTFLGPENNTREHALLRFALRFAHDGLTSRFYKKIRNEKGLAYGVSSLEYAFSSLTYFGTVVGVPYEKTALGLAAIKECYSELLSEGISQKEIDNKIDTMWFTALRSFQQNEDWINQIGYRELYPEVSYPYGSYLDIFNFYRTFSAEEILSVLNKYVIVDKTVIVYSGKA